MSCISFLAISAIVLLVEYSVLLFVGKFVGQFLVPFGILKAVAALAISYGVFLTTFPLTIPFVMMRGAPDSKPLCSEWADSIVIGLIMFGLIFYHIVVAYSIWRKVTLT